MRKHWLWVAAPLGVLLLAGLLVFVAGIGSDVDNEAQDIVGYGGPHSDASPTGRTLFHSGVPIGGRKGGESYGDFDRRRIVNSTGDFFGFACGGACAGHQAGYRWAAAHDIARPRDCVGSSWEFVEGCAAWVIRGN